MASIQQFLSRYAAAAMIGLGAFAFGAEPAGQSKPKSERTQSERYAEKTEKAEAERAKAAADEAARQAVLEPTYPVAFADATKAIDQYKAAPGLKIEVFAAEPQLANPVAFTIDHKGRFWVCETWRFDGGGPGNGVYDIRNMYTRLDDDLASKTVEQRQANLDKWNHGDNSGLAVWPDRLRLIEDRNGDGKADYSGVFAEWSQPLDGLASGVITRPNRDGSEDVYVTNIPNLYRLRDTNHDGKADEQEILSTGYGVRYSLLGHDLHGLRWGPDGKLYFSIGDRGLHVKTREGKIIDLPDEGCVLRCDPDGSNLELFARGLRNPQKLVFDNYGNLFTGDNNCDYGDPARWVYIVEGGDTGWRIGYQHLRTPKPTGPWLAEHLTALDGQNTAAYLIPPIAHIGSGPSGCTYYPGTGLPEKYKEHFFLTDFRAGPSSAVHSFALKPKGAGFEMVDRDKLLERMVVTDIEFGPDSAAYVTDWNGSWSKTGKGRIYRIFSPEISQTEQVAQTKKLINDGMFGRDSKELQTLLAHPDQRVRQAAQFELAARGTASVAILNQTAQSGPTQLARIHAIWALGQIGRTEPSALKIIPSLLADSDAEVRAQAAKLIGERKIAAAGDPLLKLLADSNARVRYFAAMSLGKIGDSAAIPAIFKLLSDNADKDTFIRHAGVMALTNLGDADALIAAADDPSPSVRMGVLLAMRRLGRAEIARFLNDPQMPLVIEAARAINDARIEAARPALAAMLNKPFPATAPATSPATTTAAAAAPKTWPEPVVLRALNSNFRLGAAENAQAVARFAARADVSDEMRIEALAMLKEWDKPRGIDRVVGVWWPVPPRDPSIAIDAARPVLGGILTSAPDGVRLAAIELATKIGPAEKDLMFRLVTAPSAASPEVAAAALEAMQTLKDPRLNEAVDAALRSGTGALRVAAIRMLAGRSDGVERLTGLLGAGGTGDQQAVLDALGSIEGAASEQILSSWMDKLLAGQVAPALQLDLVESAEKSKSDAIKEKLKAYDAKKDANDPLDGYRVALIGGDASLGRKIFFERQDVSCLRCHKINGDGGVAGPDLTGVAARHDRSYLLESIINPNRQIAPGFEAVTVKVKAGRNYTGVVKADDDKEVVIDAGDGATIHILKKEIEKRTKGLSPMPQNISQPLSKRDLRNLVEFLASLTTEPTTRTAQRR
jgi:quinoprotein glucose dehydrogenase